MTSQAQMWWLENTSAGRRLLGKMLPSSAIPMPTRRKMCAEQGHNLAGDRSTCLRCGERNLDQKER